jgi:AcrR family transcriptional regulator
MSRTASLTGPATAEFEHAPLCEEGYASVGPNAEAGLAVGRGDQIIAAAFQLLNECGLEGLTVQAVLKRAGLNRRTFYERFSGKDDLVLAVFERSLQAVAAECRAQVKAIHDPLERLRFIIDYLANPTDGTNRALNIRRSAALCREHMRLAESRPNDLRIALRPLITLLSEQLTAGVETGQVRNTAPERVANLVYNLVSTTVHAEVLAYEAGELNRTHRAQLAEEIWEFCRRAVST